MNLWLPPTMDDEAYRQAADAMAARFITDRHPLGAKLREIDPHLDLVRVTDREPNPPFGMRPGLWHLHRKNPDSPDSYVPIQGPDGEYVEPVSELVDWVKKQDAWDRRVQAANEQARSFEKARRQSARDEIRGEARDELETRIKVFENGPGVRVKRQVA